MRRLIVESFYMKCNIEDVLHLISNKECVSLKDDKLWIAKGSKETLLFYLNNIIDSANAMKNEIDVAES